MCIMYFKQCGQLEPHLPTRNANGEHVYPFDFNGMHNHVHHNVTHGESRFHV